MKGFVMTLTNQDRANRCERVLAAYSEDNTYRKLVDFVTDAMHWCHLNGLSFDYAFDTAVMHFSAESSEENTDFKAALGARISSETTRLNDLDIHEKLAERRQVALVWSVEDVRAVRPALDDDQAWEVLQHCRRVHDCDVGFNWLLIETVADDHYPPGFEVDSSADSTTNTKGD
jgi:hypothetical protein